MADTGSETSEQASAKSPLMRFLPLVLLAAAAAAFFALGLDQYLTFEALRENRALLADFVAAQGALAVLLYIVIYAVSVALSVPGAAILTVTGAATLFFVVFATPLISVTQVAAQALFP